MINLLQATAPAPQAGGGYSLFIMLGLMILVLYFFMWRPESKRRKQMAQFRAGLILNMIKYNWESVSVEGKTNVNEDFFTSDVTALFHPNPKMPI